MTAVYAGITSSHRVTVLPFKRRFYYVNGWDDMRVWDGIAATDSAAGITGPSVEASAWTGSFTEPNAGSVTAGFHDIRYRFQDSRTGYVSNPSATVTVEAAGSKDMVFAIEDPAAGDATKLQSSADSKVDTIILEATRLGGKRFYKAGTALNDAASLTWDRSDNSLSENVPTYPEKKNNTPPYFKHLTSFKDRLFGFGQVIHADGTVSTSNGSPTVTGVGTAWTDAVIGRFMLFDGETTAHRITQVTLVTSLTLATNQTARSGVAYKIFSKSNDVYFSEAGYPESWGETSFFEGIAEEAVTACVPFGNGLVIFGLTHAERFTYHTTPRADGYKSPIAGDRGALNQNVVVVVGSSVFSMDKKGWTLFRGATLEAISGQIDRWARDTLNYNYADKFHACYYPKTNSIRWFVVSSGDTLPKTYVEYQLDKQSWTTGELEVATQCSVLLPKDEGLEPSTGDENGHSWWDDTGTVLGGDEDYSHLVIDSTGSTTTTVLQLTATALPTAGMGLDGAPVTWVQSDGTKETQICESNDATSITVAGAFSDIPSAGDEILVGRIQAKLTSNWLQLGKYRGRLSGLYLWLFFEPLADSRDAVVRFYRDFGSAAHSEWGARSSSVDKLSAEGITPPADGSTDWTVDLTESPRRIPIGFEGTTVLKVELELLEPDTPLRLYRVEITGIPEEVEL